MSFKFIKTSLADSLGKRSCSEKYSPENSFWPILCTTSSDLVIILCADCIAPSNFLSIILDCLPVITQ